MLILSRRPTETIRFPQLGISVSIVSVKGNRVQVGVDAPPEIQILRRELESLSDSKNGSDSVATNSRQLPETLKRANHDFRNRLNRATLGLHLAQKQLAAGHIESADKTLANALERLAELEETTTIGPPANLQSIGLKGFVPESGFSSDRTSEPINNERPQRIDVLLVEDDPNELALLCGLLEIEGYSVHTACNGHEAIGRLEHVTPKFVLLDMMMPECDGRETLQLIRQMPSMENVPVFAVSGSSPDSIGLSIGRDGVEDWFPKPLDAPRLVKHMRHQIANFCA